MKFLAGSESRFFEFISNLNEKDKVAIISHTDGDGIGSAVIASRVVGDPALIYFYGYDPGGLLEIVDKMKKKKINKAIFLDLNPLESEIHKIEKFADILLIDHHPFDKDLNSSKVWFIKGDCDAASYMAYYLFSKIQKIPEWIAAFGTLSDTTYKYSEDTINEFFKDFGFSKIDGLWENTFDLNLLLVYFKDNLEKAYDILMNAKDLDDSEAKKLSEIVKEEYKKIISEFESKKESYGDLIFYYFEARFDVKTLAINILSVENYNKTLVFAEQLKGEKYLRISLRRQDGKVDCPRLLKKSVAGMNYSNAGGHFKAAGAGVLSRDLEKFRENLLREYKKLSH